MADFIEREKIFYWSWKDRISLLKMMLFSFFFNSRISIKDKVTGFKSLFQEQRLTERIDNG